ncbi:MAG: hypothetical protein EBS01_04790, partial [Verrucomicrobia bacterium]|nr:hypothetical protein [Verrucomicrobiota bacterium]
MADFVNEHSLPRREGGSGSAEPGGAVRSADPFGALHPGGVAKVTYWSAARRVVVVVRNRLLSFVRKRGLRYLLTGAACNGMSILLSTLLFGALKLRLGVVAASLICGLIHGVIIYSGHFFFTFSVRQPYFRGLAKSLTGNIPITIVFNVVSIYVLKKQLLPFWLLQVLLLAIGQIYGILTNIFWVFHEESLGKVKE